MTEKGISIIVCCYNSEKRLPKTLEYLAKQTISKEIPVELIIVNNVSTDRTKEVAKEEWKQYDSHFQLRIVDEEKAGQMFARQRGVHESQYEYILFCDDDNWLETDYMQIAFDLMEANPRIGALGGQSIAVSDVDFPEWFSDFYDGYALGQQAHTSGDISERRYVWGAGMFTRKMLLTKVFDKNYPLLIEGRTGSKLISGDDNEICMRILLLGYTLYYDSSLVFYHYMSPNRLTWAYKKDLWEGFKVAWSSYGKYHLIYREMNKSFWNKTKGILHHILKIPLKSGDTKNKLKAELAVKLGLLFRSTKISKDLEYRKILRFLFDNR